MTKDEFISKWAAGRGWEPAEDWGVRTGDRIRIALPCYCGDSMCEGWAMVRPEEIERHIYTDGIDPKFLQATEAL